MQYMEHAITSALNSSGWLKLDGLTVDLHITLPMGLLFLMSSPE